MNPSQLWSRPGLPTPSLVGVRPELSAPDQECLVPESGPLQVFDQGRHGLVGLVAVERVVLDAVHVAVPGFGSVSAARVELDETDALLDEPPRDEALAAEVGGETVVEPVHLPGLLVLLLQVHHLGGRGLHPVGQLVGVDPGGQFRLLLTVFQMLSGSAAVEDSGSGAGSAH